MQYRRFGRTEFQMPVLTCGGMRFQQSWKGSDAVTSDRQKTLEECVYRALDLGVNHFETARGYGTSEAQLGEVLPKLPRAEILVQTKVGPMEDVAKFVTTFEKSIGLLKLDHVDLLSFHGINTPQTLEWAQKCMDTVLAWKREGRIRAIGFSTHGPTDVIVDAINTDAFDHVNLHWYYIFQDNWPAIEAAKRHDMGVFIISPNDKAGLLYRPSEKLVELTAPLHPMVFSGLFCLAQPQVHTISIGVSTPEDWDIHVETMDAIEDAAQRVAPIVERLENEMAAVLGAEWAQRWSEGLPEWHETPGEVNIRWILRLRNLALAYDMVEYGKMRYNMLGSGSHWFPGMKANELDGLDFSECLKNSPFADTIPQALAEAEDLLGAEAKQRLMQD